MWTNFKSNNFKTYLLLSFVALCYFNDLTEATPPLQAVRQRGHSHGSDVPPMSQSSTNDPKAGNARLPTDVVPVHYDLQISPIIDEDDNPLEMELNTADGIVVITVRCLSTTKNITFHSSPLIDIETTEVQLRGVALTIDRNTTDPAEDFYTIIMQNDLVVGNEYTVTIKFIAPVATKIIDGLYLSTYTTPGGSTPWVIAVTQFAAKAARQAFPCFDEPGFKTPFDITVGRSKGFMALSNGELVDSQDVPIGNSSWVYDKFATTVSMSTYLVAIVVSQYAFEEADMKLPDNQTVKATIHRISIYGPEHMISDRKGGVYAAKTSAEVMTFYHDYFQMPYKMGKMDSVVIPDFYFGAMENWGIITYREIYLMYYEGESTEAERRRTSEIISHESAHQWFGNLITCKWWNHVWLNEGFATYLSYKGSQSTDPEFEPLKGMLTDAVQYSMTFDVDPSTSHPIRSDDSIGAPLYDRINYEKAASLIRMMEGFLSPNTLQKALQAFLQEHQFKAVDQDDLFLSLTAEAHNDHVIPSDWTMKDIMDTWTRQSGYPLIRVSKSFTENSIMISQERFVDGLPAGDLDPSELWYIPVSIATQTNPDFSNHTPKFWLEKDTALKIYSHNTSTWIVVNPDATGYYRVLYDSPLFALITQQLVEDHSVISAFSRSQLMDDYFTMAFRGFVRIERALELTAYLQNENELIVWESVFLGLTPTLRMLSGTAAFASFREYILPKIYGATLPLGFEQPAGERGNRVLLRVQLLDWACALELESCLASAAELYAKWEVDPYINPIPVDLRPVVYCAMVGNGDQSVFGFVHDRYREISTPPKQIPLLMNALACSKESYFLQTMLEHTLDEDDSFFRENDRLLIIERILQNSVGRPLVINFIREKFQLLLNNIAPVESFKPLFNSIGQYCKTSVELTQFQDFAMEYETQLVSVAQDVQRTLASIQSNIDWLKSYYQPMNEWFQEQTSSNNEIIV